MYLDIYFNKLYNICMYMIKWLQFGRGNLVTESHSHDLNINRGLQKFIFIKSM